MAGTSLNDTIPERVTITDDTMREGLQIESPDISVDAKLRLLDALGETGAKVISIGSFAHPKWTPSMACIEEIAEKLGADYLVDGSVSRSGTRLRITASLIDPQSDEQLWANDYDEEMSVSHLFTIRNDVA